MSPFFLDSRYLTGKKYLESHTFIFIIETKFYIEVIKITKLYLTTLIFREIKCVMEAIPMCLGNIKNRIVSVKHNLIN
jgi:hypothetical protein